MVFRFFSFFSSHGGELSASWVKYIFYFWLRRAKGSLFTFHFHYRFFESSSLVPVVTTPLHSGRGCGRVRPSLLSFSVAKVRSSHCAFRMICQLFSQKFVFSLYDAKNHDYSRSIFCSFLQMCYSATVLQLFFSLLHIKNFLLYIL